MLSKPYAGWTTLTYKNFNESISYLDDIPITWTNIFKLYLTHIVKNNLQGYFPLHLIGDCEGWDLNIVAYYYGFQLYTDEDRPNEFYDLDMDYMLFIKEVCNDFENEIDEWARWGTLGEAYDYDEETQDLVINKEIEQKIIDERKQVILDNIKEIRKLIQEIENEDSQN